ncbi:rod shape-determining protein RodA [Brevibacillus massiliensis]|jgi:rod shape determining protein RodA|uniref:rod shape-determining protein RodA n=1 Tax=Brevibacillus massiliensis TaxID=1118054 RepID=UPI0002EC1590|nr:rod shape-determining protein RodA [Brevibacillus massiliensis]
MGLEKRYLKELDWVILVILLCLGVFSYLGISGSGTAPEVAVKQIIWYVLGFVILFVTLLFDYRVYQGLAYFAYGIGIVLLIGVLFTEPIYGAHSWYKLGPILFQPSEPMKLFVIVAVARMMAKQQENHLKPIQTLPQLLSVCLVVGVPMLLILKQSDLGTAMVYAGFLATMLIVGGIRLRHVAMIGCCVGLFFAAMALLYEYDQNLFFKIIKQYQWNRIVYWIDPYEDAKGFGFQLIQSLIAIGSGQLSGKGFTTATQASYGWVPVGESDFIFTVLGEKMGFIGGGLLMILFFLLIYRLIRIAMEARDPFGTYIVAGVVGMLTFQVFENIGMTIQLMPITGIPLPFISYGGSSIVTNFFIMGIVLNIGMRKKALMFD